MTLRTADQVLLWSPAEQVEVCGVALSAAEEQRNAALLQPADRSAHRAAHVLVRRAAAQLLGTGTEAIEVVQVCTECGGLGHGRPSVVDHPEVSISLSHAVRGARSVVAAMAVIAVPGPVGIDVEIRGARVPSAALTAAERTAVGLGADPLLLWTRKEAAVKAGAGDLAGLSRQSVLDPIRLGGRELVFTDRVGPGWVGTSARWA